jgi:hypothetical protein
MRAELAFTLKTEWRHSSPLRLITPKGLSKPALLVRLKGVQRPQCGS